MEENILLTLVVRVLSCPLQLGWLVTRPVHGLTKNWKGWEKLNRKRSINTFFSKEIDELIRGFKLLLYMREHSIDIPPSSCQSLGCEAPWKPKSKWQWETKRTQRASKTQMGAACSWIASFSFAVCLPAKSKKHAKRVTVCYGTLNKQCCELTPCSFVDSSGFLLDLLLDWDLLILHLFTFSRSVLQSLKKCGAFEYNRMKKKLS